MNFIDLLILALVLLALRRGLRLGLLSLVLSAGGFISGLYAGSLVANVLGGGIEDAAGRLLAAVTLSITAGFLLSGIGESIAMAAGRHVQRWRLEGLNKAFGAAFEVTFALLIVWLLASTLANVTTGNLGRHIRSSAAVSTLNSRLPPPPDLLSALEGVLDANGFPKAFIGNEPSRGPVPNTTPLNDEVIRTAQASIVQITGRGCGGIVEGSGFVAANNVVVTNAHVVAGITHPRVYATNGEVYDATAIHFDSELDIAMLRIRDLPIAPLPLTANTLPNGASIAVMGYPGGGPLRISGGVILESLTAIGRNIYDRGVIARDIYAVQAVIESGNSGGPMIDGEGRVAGVVFAKSVSEDHIGYTVRSSEVITALERYGASHASVSTGRCAAN